MPTRFRFLPSSADVAAAEEAEAETDAEGERVKWHPKPIDDEGPKAFGATDLLCSPGPSTACGRMVRYLLEFSMTKGCHQLVVRTQEREPGAAAGAGQLGGERFREELSFGGSGWMDDLSSARQSGKCHPF